MTLDQSSREQDEAAYLQLRKRSAISVGCPANSRRIFSLDCRIDGSDCAIEVGGRLPNRDGVVVAILDHGRHEPFAVHMNPAERDLLRISHPVYSVTEFS
jgi:hypothetical protein